MVDAVDRRRGTTAVNVLATSQDGGADRTVSRWTT
jgi:hypothetical protein